MTKAGHSKFEGVEVENEEVLRGGRNTYAIMPNRRPSDKRIDPTEVRLPTFLSRDDHPMPHVAFHARRMGDALGGAKSFNLSTAVPVRMFNEATPMAHIKLKTR